MPLNYLASGAALDTTDFIAIARPKLSQKLLMLLIMTLDNIKTKVRFNDVTIDEFLIVIVSCYLYNPHTTPMLALLYPYFLILLSNGSYQQFEMPVEDL